MLLPPPVPDLPWSSSSLLAVPSTRSALDLFCLHFPQTRSGASGYEVFFQFFCFVFLFGCDCKESIDVFRAYPLCGYNL
ncbi:unnamed protein product [Camellia sinensis]